MESCIIISDDENDEVQVIKHLVHLDKEPIVIDLTRGYQEAPKASPIPPKHPTETPVSNFRPRETPTKPTPTPIKQPSPVVPECRQQEIPRSVPTSPKRPPSPVFERRKTPEPSPVAPQQPATHVFVQKHQETSKSAPISPNQPPSSTASEPVQQEILKSAPIPPNQPPSSTASDFVQQEIPKPAPIPSKQPTPHVSHHVHQETLKPAPTPPKQPTSLVSDYELMIGQKALGNEKYKHNLFNDAIKVYRRALELAKKLGDKEISAILHFNLAMTYYKIGSFNQAAGECANAVKINGNYMKAHLKRAEIYQRQGKFEEAVICYEHICELDNCNPDYVLLLNHAREAAKKSKKKDYYGILGLSYNFTKDDLRKAYRQQALSHHPDRHSDADIVTRRIEERLFKEASEAHTWIKMRLGFRL